MVMKQLPKALAAGIRVTVRLELPLKKILEFGTRELSLEAAVRTREPEGVSASATAKAITTGESSGVVRFEMGDIVGVMDMVNCQPPAICPAFPPALSLTYSVQFP